MPRSEVRADQAGHARETVGASADHRSAFVECRGGGGEEVRWIYLFRRSAEIILRDLSRHTKEGKRLRRIARIAMAYEDADRAAHEATNYFPAYYANSQPAGVSYLAAARELQQHEPVTMQGILVVASAMALLPKALAAAGYKLEGIVAAPAVGIGEKLAAAVIRIEGGAQ